jgi:hypothetical protein
VATAATGGAGVAGGGTGEATGGEGGGGGAAGGGGVGGNAADASGAAGGLAAPAPGDGAPHAKQDFASVGRGLPQEVQSGPAIGHRPRPKGNGIVAPAARGGSLNRPLPRAPRRRYSRDLEAGTCFMTSLKVL